MDSKITDIVLISELKEKEQKKLNQEEYTF